MATPLLTANWRFFTAKKISKTMIRQHPVALLAIAALLLFLSVPGQAANTKWSNINPLPKFTDIKDVIWDGSSYIAVGSGGLIITSPDGVSWTPQTLSVIHQLYGIAFSGSRYVVVGDRGLVASKKVGDSRWTFQTTGVTTALLTVAWSPTLGFVAGGSNGVLITSPDGTSWTKQDSGFGAALEEIIWNPDRQEFITVTSGGGNNNIFTSNDGKTWIPRHISRGNILRGIVWTGAQYVAVGANATVLTSPKGFTWTLQQTSITSSFTNITLFDIAWDGTQFVSVGIANFKDLVDPVSLILSSSDAVNWTAQNLDNLGVPKTSEQLQAINWNGSRFLSAGVGTLLSSPDALTWTSENSDVTGQAADLRAVAANGAGKLVAVGAGGAVVSSTDGNTWTDQTANAAVGALALNGISWGSIDPTTALFIAVGDNGTVITSPDGSNWTARTSNTTVNLNGITRGSIAPTTALFVAVGDNGTVITSPDGISWALQNSGTTRILKAITRDISNGLFVAVGAGGIILTSPDGNTWTQQSSPTTQNLNGVIRGGNELVAVGDKETVVSSLNDLSWQSVFLKTPNTAPINLHAIDWNGTQYLVTADSGFDGRTPDKGGLLLYSQDAVSCIPNAQITTESLLATAWNGTQFVVVGTKGTILSSGIPDLAIKVAVTPMPAVQNQPLLFSSTISNTSGLIAPAVSWDYLLPSGVSFVSVSPDQGSCQEINNRVSCVLGDIDAGAEQVNVTVKVIPGPVTLASNTASINNNGSANSDINLANNQATLVSTVNKEVIVLKNPDTTSSRNSVGAFGPALLSLLLFYSWRRWQKHANRPS